MSVNSNNLSINIFPKLCRICLSQENKLEPLFNNEKPIYLKMLQTLFVNTFDKYDGLPRNICNKCIDELVFTYKFINKYNESSIALHKCVINYHESLISITSKSDYNLYLSNNTDQELPNTNSVNQKNDESSLRTTEINDDVQKNKLSSNKTTVDNLNLVSNISINESAKTNEHITNLTSPNKSLNELQHLTQMYEDTHAVLNNSLPKENNDNSNTTHDHIPSIIRKLNSDTLKHKRRLEKNIKNAFSKSPFNNSIGIENNPHIDSFKKFVQLEQSIDNIFPKKTTPNKSSEHVQTVPNATGSVCEPVDTTLLKKTSETPQSLKNSDNTVKSSAECIKTVENASTKPVSTSSSQSSIETITNSSSITTINQETNSKELEPPLSASKRVSVSMLNKFNVTEHGTSTKPSKIIITPVKSSEKPINNLISTNSSKKIQSPLIPDKYMNPLTVYYLSPASKNVKYPIIDSDQKRITDEDYFKKFNLKKCVVKLTKFDMCAGEQVITNSVSDNVVNGDANKISEQVKTSKTDSLLNGNVKTNKSNRSELCNNDKNFDNLFDDVDSTFEFNFVNVDKILESADTDVAGDNNYLSDSDSRSFTLHWDNDDSLSTTSSIINKATVTIESEEEPVVNSDKSVVNGKNHFLKNFSLITTKEKQQEEVQKKCRPKRKLRERKASNSSSGYVHTKAGQKRLKIPEINGRHTPLTSGTVDFRGFSETDRDSCSTCESNSDANNEQLLTSSESSSLTSGSLSNFDQTCSKPNPPIPDKTSSIELRNHSASQKQNGTRQKNTQDTKSVVNVFKCPECSAFFYRDVSRVRHVKVFHSKLT